MIFRFFVIIWILWITVANAVYSQTTIQQTLDRAEKHIQDAERYYAEMNYLKAKESYQFAAHLYRNNNLSAYYAICYNGIGNVYIDQNFYEDAKNQGFERALQQLSEIKSIDPSFDVDSSLVADAYEGMGRYYSSISSSLVTQKGTVTKIHYDKALEYHQKALRIRKTLYNNVHPKIALSHYYMSQAYRGFSTNLTRDSSVINPIQEELHQLEIALEIQQKTIGEEHYQTANTYEALGNFYYEIQKDFHKGVEFHQKALHIREKVFNSSYHPQVASSFQAMAIYYRVMNMFEKEFLYLEKALSIQRNVLGKEHSQIAKSYYLLGNRHKRAGALDKALSYYQLSMDVLDELRLVQSVEGGELSLAMALVYRELQQYDKAWTFLNKSYSIHEKVLGKKHFKLGAVHLAMGDYYLHKKHRDSSLYQYNTALAIFKQQLGEKHYTVVETYDKIANLYNVFGNKELELEFLTKALNTKLDKAYLQQNTNQRIYGLEDSDLNYENNQNENKTLEQQLYFSYLRLADYYKNSSDYRQALQYIQDALAIVSPSLVNNQQNIYTNPSKEDLSRNIAWLEALQEKATLFKLLYKNKTHADRDLAFAAQTYLLAVEVIDLLRTNFTLDESKQALTQQSIPIYEGAIETFYIFYNKSQNAEYLNKAFEIAERSKGFVVLQALQNNLAKGNSNIPNELLEKEEKLRQQLAYYSNSNNRDSYNNPSFDKVYFEIKQSYDSLILLLEKNYSTYYNLKYQTKVTSTIKVQTLLLGDNDLLLEYFIGDNHLYVFKISKSTKDFFQVLVPENYETLVTSLRGSLTNYDLLAKHPRWAYQSFVYASQQFYAQFLQPFMQNTPSNINRLTIISDGLLNYIPFEVLIDNVSTTLESGNYKDLSYLLKKYQINYGYSATLLTNNSLKNKPSNNYQCLGFAPYYQGATSNNNNLPWTQKELNAIENIFDGQYYYGEKANKNVFKEQANSFGIIHLAMHGLVNVVNPMLSQLYFSETSDTSNKEQHSLFAYEIHNLTIQANLVVLSACETGFGKATRGEGVLSLARAFLYAGAPSVVTTLWKVNDFASAALIETFYSNLSQGMSKPEALQQAKLSFLAKTDEISGHPAYWASFISIGSPAPLSKGTNWWLWGGAGAAVLLLILSLLFYKNKKAKQTPPKEEEIVPTITNSPISEIIVSTPTTLQTLPSDLLELHQLDLSRNGLEDLDNLPFVLESCTNLNYLDLSYNYLEYLPSTLPLLSNLKTLILEHNPLEHLPLVVCEMSSLEQLRLNSIELSHLPNSIYQLQQLQLFDLSSNSLSELPPTIGLLKSLQSLDLSNNKLHTLPNELIKLENLTELNLANNLFDVNELEAIQELLPNVRLVF